MPKAIWNGQVRAESDETQVVEGNHYFPPATLKQDFFRPSTATSQCGWKGTANYFDIEVDGNVNEQAAWYYAEPLPAAREIKGYVAFWKGVQVED